MMPIEEIRERLADRKIRVVSEKTGLGRATIYRFLTGDDDYRISTVKALSDYLSAQEI